MTCVDGSIAVQYKYLYFCICFIRLWLLLCLMYIHLQNSARLYFHLYSEFIPIAEPEIDLFSAQNK